MLTHTNDEVEAKSNQRETRGYGRRSKRNLRRERRLWHNPTQKTYALGCHCCPDRDLCGGLQIQTTFYDCLQFCCSTPDTCDRVCRNHPDFPDRVREVGGFDLETLPHGNILYPPLLPHVVPMVYHRNGCVWKVPSQSVALPLYRMFDHPTGEPRFTTPEALRKAFGITLDTMIVLTGIDRDPPLERWWNLGEVRRRVIIRAVKAAGVTMVTTPNYSLFTDRPRQDNLYSIMRTAITHTEFLNEGLSAALHVSGRTETDFRRWATYISTRPEITHLAYEFTTGTGWAGRQEQHAFWLIDLADKIGRPLHLVIRGGTKILPILSRHFSNITILDTTSFMKTVMRQRAYPNGNTGISWEKSPMPTGAPLDDLFANNTTIVEAQLKNLAARSVEGTSTSE